MGSYTLRLLVVEGLGLETPSSILLCLLTATHLHELVHLGHLLGCLLLLHILLRLLLTAKAEGRHVWLETSLLLGLHWGGLLRSEQVHYVIEVLGRLLLSRSRLEILEVVRRSFHPDQVIHGLRRFRRLLLHLNGLSSRHRFTLVLLDFGLLLRWNFLFIVVFILVSRGT